MASRVYFYKDEQGSTRKYIYCSMCQAGPFKDEDIDKYKVYNFGHPVYYCTKCNNILNMGETVRGFEIPLHEPKKVVLDTPIEKIKTKKPIDIFEEDDEIPVKESLEEKTPVELPPKKAPVIKIKEPVEKPAPKIIIPTPIVEKQSIKGACFVYILEGNDGSYLQGIVPDLKSSLNSVYKGISDRNKFPVELVFHKKFDKENEAELYLKGVKKRSKDAKATLIKNFERDYLNRSF